MTRRFSYAFTTWHEDGSLIVCDQGDLWQWVVSPQDDDESRWSYFGPVLDVEASQLSPKHRDALTRCQAHYRKETPAK